MKKRIFCSMVALVGSAMALCFIFITGLLYEHYSNLQTEQLKETASYIEQGYEAAGRSYLETLHTGTNRVTLIAKDGTVLYDSQEQDVSQMSNHADREEVQQAEQDGVGFSRRFSSTMSKETVYYAVRLSDQSVLRVSVEYRSLFAMMGVLLMQALFILLVMLILALLVSYQLTKKIVKPINTLDLEHPEQVSTYEELDPLLCKLASQNREIVQKMDILRQQQYEFSMITEHMQEGLFVIDHAYTILTCNQSAMRLFGLQHSVLQKNILTVERGEPFRNVLDEALRGRHCTSQLEREGRVYQLIANPVLHNETPQEMQVREDDLIGVVILILDITEKETQERYRREFTANVSHELKTPLTVILANLRILLSHKDATIRDELQWVESTQEEAGRMKKLVENLLFLARSDAKSTPMLYSTFSFSDLILGCLLTFEPVAFEQGVMIEDEISDDIFISGDAPQIRQLVAILLDNACKYAGIADVLEKSGSSDKKVTVTLTSENEKIKLTVHNTGKAIPEEDLPHLFERFYRTDKSRARTDGGYGLGLAIAQTIAKNHHGKITVVSAKNLGTSFTVTFPVSKEKESA